MREAREKIAQRYSEAFASLEELVIPEVIPDRRTSWHLYILRLRQVRLSLDRDGFIRSLNEKGIGCSVHFIPLHLQPYYQRVLGYKAGDLPNAERQYNACLSLPIFPDMKDEEIEHVIQSVRDTVWKSRIFRTDVASSPIA